MRVWWEHWGVFYWPVQSCVLSGLPWSLNNKQTLFQTPSWRIVCHSSFCLNLVSQLVFPRKTAPMKESLCSTQARRTTWITGRSTLGTAWGKDSYGAVSGTYEGMFCLCTPWLFRLPCHSRTINFTLCGIFYLHNLYWHSSESLCTLV